MVMPVRNALPFLGAAIASILDQTYRNFRLVIRDDGSTDGSTDELRRWAERDHRIDLFVADESAGPAGSSNWVVRQARTPLVARMDADDVAHPDRLRRQVTALTRDREAILVGTLWRGIDGSGRPVRGPDDWRLVRNAPFPPFPHGSIMFRRDAFHAAGGYRPQCDYWEDLDLMLRLGEMGRILVLSDTLYDYRHAHTSTRLTSAAERVEDAADLLYRCIRALADHGSYEHVLRDEPPGGGRLSPDAFISVASNRLWAGQKPRALQRLARRARLRPDLASARALVWAAWGEISPASLRGALRGIAWLRNRRIRPPIESGVAYEWRGHEARA